MKRILLLLALPFVMACSVEEPYFAVDTKPCVLYDNTSYATFTVSTNLEWDYSVADSWVTVTTNKDDYYNKEKKPNDYHFTVWLGNTPASTRHTKVYLWGIYKGKKYVERYIDVTYIKDEQ